MSKRGKVDSENLLEESNDGLTLVERARGYSKLGPAKKYQDQDYELAAAVLSGEISIGQAARAWRIGTGPHVYWKVVTALIEAQSDGWRLHWERREEAARNGQ